MSIALMKFGYPEFGLSCSGDEPILKLPKDTYYVKNINYTNSTIALVDIDVTGQTCPRARHNLTLENLPLGYTNLDLNLSFYFNCTSSPFSYSVSAIGCLEFSTKQSYVSMTENQINDVDWIGKCEEKVVATVMRTEITTNGLISEFGGAMNNGFMLDWRTVKGCGSCEDSGGFCGYNKTAAEFKCFCRDGTVHSNRCKDNDDTGCIQVSCGENGPRNAFYATDDAPFRGQDLPDCNTSVKAPVPSRELIRGLENFTRVLIEGFNVTYKFNNSCGTDPSPTLFECLCREKPDRAGCPKASAVAYEEDTCPTPLHNLTLDLTPFNISPDYFDFYFLYNCTSKPTKYLTYPIRCAANSTVYSFAGFHIEKLEISSNYSLDSCNYFVNAPLHTGSDLYSLFHKNYTEILKMGFLLNWTAHTCSTCEGSGGRCGFENHEFVCFCHDRTHLNSCDDDNNPNVPAKVGIGVGAFLGGVIACVIVFIYLRRRRKPYAPSSFVSKSTTSDFSKSDIEKGEHYFAVHLFSYSELEEATNNFDSAKELGDGGFGTVYYGKLRDGRAVAVKRLHRHEINLSNMAINKIQSDALDELVDHNLGFESNNAARGMITAVAELAFQCLQSAKELRPSMEQVLETLKEIQNKDYDIGKKTQETDILSDDVGLLKSGQLPRSPDTVMMKWLSNSTTPNISG
ncbi:hypothetical protein GH714_033214 [Hevea brasiliensis]|uniref:non-specific serine/threonine protein kinase n=1 Tax=Hevea brasiliensis TaxID=3981 RepID=A0A6A6L5K7_HEVBR|nr:hypothetical protein GH714_033214 [Hevea brasiliensis]